MAAEPLHERLNALAVEIDKLGDELGERSIPGGAAAREYATVVAELAQECERDYVRLESEGDTPTIAQGVALARFLRPHFRPQSSVAPVANVSRGGAGLPADYLYVRFADGYEGGIAPDGRTST